MTRALLIIGEKGNLALSIQGIVADPASAPMQIFAMLFGANASPRSGSTFEKTGILRRGMKEEDLAKLGKIFVTKNEQIGKILRKDP